MNDLPKYTPSGKMPEDPDELTDYLKHNWLNFDMLEQVVNEVIKQAIADFGILIRPNPNDENDLLVTVLLHYHSDGYNFDSAKISLKTALKRSVEDGEDMTTIVKTLHNMADTFQP